jgi:hypothetical protein
MKRLTARGLPASSGFSKSAWSMDAVWGTSLLRRSGRWADGTAVLTRCRRGTRKSQRQKASISCWWLYNLEEECVVGVGTPGQCDGDTNYVFRCILFVLKGEQVEVWGSALPSPRSGVDTRQFGEEMKHGSGLV